MIRIGLIRPGQPKHIIIILTVRVGHPNILLLLIGSIHDLERIPTYKLIIPIDQHLHIILMTVTIGRIDNIIGSIVPPQILDKFDPILGEANLLHVLDCTVHGLIGGFIINKHNMIVVIPLLDDGLQHLHIPIILNIIPTKNSHTETNLLTQITIFIKLILLIKLFVFNLLYRVVLGQVD